MKPQIRVVHSNNNGNQQLSMVDLPSGPVVKRISKDHLPMLVPVHVPRVPTTHGPASQSTQAPAQDAPRYYCRDPYQEPQRPTTAVPAMPQAWNTQMPAAPQRQSPFVNSYNSPPASACIGANRAAQPAYQPQGQVPPPYSSSSNPDAGKMGNGEAMNRKSESLRRFNGNPSEFIRWSQHFTDHMAKVHAAWRYTLEWVATANDDIRMARLQNDVLGPYRETSADLAIKLEQVIVDYLPQTQYGRREQLCGGKGETGNGFAMWRRLFK